MTRQQMNIVIAGHVDHGKSTVVGRLMVDTGSLPKDKLEQVRELCQRTSRPFEYAFLLDALKDERSQGITIDSARVFFKTKRRDYIIIDAPGHIEFLKNMISGASRAEAALLVIDAKEGVRENSRRHGYMLSMLGISKVAVLVNKMDLIGYDQRGFDRVVAEYRGFLAEFGVTPAFFIPASGFHGENIAERSSRMAWYGGPMVLEALDAFESEKAAHDKAFRMPVQDVYKFTKSGDDRRIVAGTIESGALNLGDEVVFLPSGKKSRVRSIEGFNVPKKTRASAGEATGFTLSEQIYITRGEIACRAGEKAPCVSTRFSVSLFWLGKEPMVANRDYVLKLGAARVPVRIEKISKVLDASTLQGRSDAAAVARHEVAECVLATAKPLAFDVASEIAGTGRFVIVDDYEISGGGIIREPLNDKQSWVREKVMLRDFKWENSSISSERRAERYGQKSALVLVTGAHEADRKTFAKALEAKLFGAGRVVYYLGIGSLLYGVDADIKRGGSEPSEALRQEHLRRLAEVAHIMLDAGMILVVSAAELRQDDVELIKTMVGGDLLETVWVGEPLTTDLMPGLKVEAGRYEDLERVRSRLQERGVIYKPE